MQFVPVIRDIPLAQAGGHATCNQWPENRACSVWSRRRESSSSEICGEACEAARNSRSHSATLMGAPPPIWTQGRRFQSIEAKARMSPGCRREPKIRVAKDLGDGVSNGSLDHTTSIGQRTSGCDSLRWSENMSCSKAAAASPPVSQLLSCPTVTTMARPVCMHLSEPACVGRWAGRGEGAWARMC